MITKDKLRQLPGIDKLVLAAKENKKLKNYPTKILTKVCRDVVSDIRNKLIKGIDICISTESLLGLVNISLNKIYTSNLRRVINATGVVLHTNLGRAPLSKRAVDAINDVASNYSTLEYDLEKAERGSRYSHIVDYIKDLTQSEDAIAVNNNAGAVLLVLSALTSGKEVIVSRGQLVEIGGSFRIPDVMQQSGAKLIEVGTTNKTHLRDFEAAITENTAAILRVHTSNYRIIGFTSQPEEDELVALAKKHNLMVIDDLGSGTFIPIQIGDWREPSAGDRIKAGFDIVTFSGDKLLGAGQAGIIAGKKKYIEIIKKHPLLRALRIDKLSLAALEGTLQDYLLGEPLTEIPTHRMLNLSQNDLEERAKNVSEGLSFLVEFGWQLKIIKLESQTGGGSLPTIGLAGFGVSIKATKYSATTIEGLLRLGNIPIIVRIQDNEIVLDVRTLLDDDLAIIKDAFYNIANGEKK